MDSQYLKKKKLPDAPGVYLFKKNKDILYIGKATSLKDRVKSYFGTDILATRSPLISDMVFKAGEIDFIKTDSVLEALILESNLIKKHQPKYNSKEKDDKSYNYVVITKEYFPRVLIERGRNLQGASIDFSYTNKFGPYTNGTQLREAVKIIRKIFPFRDKCKLGQERACFNYQIGLCPGVCVGVVTKQEYVKIIRNIKLFFEGKKKQIIRNLDREMKVFAKSKEFEKAAKVRNTIFALNHIWDVALISASEDNLPLTPSLSGGENGAESPLIRGLGVSRIEAYDAAHLSGTNNVGVMVVMEDGELKKSDYRKFKIRDSKGNDVGALKEILERRLKHTEWPLPNLIVVDGGLVQLNVAKNTTAPNPSLTKEGKRKKIAVVAVTKDNRHKAKGIIGPEDVVKKYKKEILLINAEAHRFAIAFHRQKRSVIL